MVERSAENTFKQTCPAGAYRLKSDRPVTLQVLKVSLVSPKQADESQSTDQAEWRSIWNCTPLRTKMRTGSWNMMREEGNRLFAVSATREEIPAWMSSPSHQQGSRFVEYWPAGTSNHLYGVKLVLVKALESQNHSWIACSTLHSLFAGWASFKTQSATGYAAQPNAPRSSHCVLLWKLQGELSIIYDPRLKVSLGFGVKQVQMFSF